MDRYTDRSMDNQRLQEKSQQNHTSVSTLFASISLSLSGTEIGVCGQERDKYDTLFLLATGFLSPSLKQSIRDTCDLTEGDSTKWSKECQNLIKTMYEQIGEVGRYGCLFINLYVNPLIHLSFYLLSL